MALAIPPNFQRELEKSVRHPFAIIEIDGKGQEVVLDTQGDFYAVDISNIGLDYNGTLRDLTSGTYKWTASGGGTNEYYLELAAGGDPGIVEPIYVVFSPDPTTNDYGPAAQDPPGTLANHFWGWGDNDSLGFDTVYFADATGDPDTTGIGLVDPGNAPTPGDLILARDGTGSDIQQSFPTGDVSVGGWFANAGQRYDAVNEVIHDGDITYIYTGADSDSYLADSAFQTDLIDNIPNNAHILKVSVHIVGRMESGSTISDGRLLLTFDGTTYESNRLFSLGTTYAEREAAFTFAPSPGPWRKDDLLAITSFGVKTGTITGGGSIRVTQLKLSVTYWDFQASGVAVFEFDLGVDAKTTNKATITIDDYKPAETNITYQTEGSGTGAWLGEEVSLGFLEDGEKFDGYRFYRVEIAMTTVVVSGTAAATPVVQSIGIAIPDVVYSYSTYPKEVLGAVPLLKEIPSQTLELDLKDFTPKTSSLFIEISRTEEVDVMARDEYFRNRDTRIKIGMWTPTITPQDLLIYNTGRVTDYEVFEGTIKLTIKDATKDLSRKVPEGIAPSTIVSQTYDGEHQIQVILDLIEKAGVRTRHINKGSFNVVQNNVGDGSPASGRFIVYRGANPPGDPGATWDTTIVESSPAKDCIAEVLAILGAYIVTLEDGKLNCVEYDSSIAALDTWDRDTFFKDAKYTPGLESLRNQVYVNYDYDGLGSEIANYHSIAISADSTSQNNWEETVTKIIESKWIGGDSSDGYYGAEIASHVVVREKNRLKDGLGTFTCRTSLDQCAYQLGDFINIDSALLINPDTPLGGTSKFIITLKVWDVGKDMITWKLTEAR